MATSLRRQLRSQSCRAAPRVRKWLIAVDEPPFGKFLREQWEFIAEYPRDVNA
jgi:hypothetical protein